MRSAAYITRCKFWNIDDDQKRACIPKLIWNDGHGEWSRAWYWFKDEFDRLGRGQYIGFKTMWKKNNDICLICANFTPVDEDGECFIYSIPNHEVSICTDWEEKDER